MNGRASQIDGRDRPRRREATAPLILALFRALTLVAAFIAGPVDAASQAVEAEFELGLRYLNTLYDFDFQALGEQLAEDAVFRDPTATPIAGAALFAEGRQEIVAKFSANAAGSRNGGFEVERHFTSGEYVVFTLVYSAEIRGELVGIAGVWIPVRIPAVTVLRVVGSEISEHTDYVDYDALLQQVAAFEADHKSPEALGSGNDREESGI